jgi:tetratricopeptide (TPR) repeat protein
VRTAAVLAAAAVFAASAAARPQPPQTTGDALARHRNLGKAFYENPTTHREAVDEFRRALALAPASAVERINYGLALLRAGRTAEGIGELERAQRQDPSIPNTSFTLGIEYKKAADYPRAIAQFERMARLVPDEPISQFNLGYLYRLAGRTADAQAAFERAAAIDPAFAAPHFQLSSLAREAGRAADADREQETFLRLKRASATAATPEDVDWSRYAEIVDPPQTPAPADAAAPRVSFRSTVIADGIDAASAGIAVLDADGDGRPDAIVWSRAGLRLLKGGVTVVDRAGLDAVTDVRAVAAGDYDNDGLPDLCVLTADAAVLFQNRGGTFQRSAAALPAGSFDAALWLDYDHDYDLDLLLLGSSTTLMRNGGAAGFSDRTADIPFAPGRARAATVIDVVPDEPAHDLVVAYADRSGMLYRDRLAAGYEAQRLDAIPPDTRQLEADDLNADGAVDLVAAGAGGVTALINQHARFEPRLIAAAPAGVALADVEGRGTPDVAGGRTILRNDARGVFAAGAPLPDSLAAIAASDFDQDGREDLLGVDTDGTVRLLRNETGTGHHWIRVRLTGVKNLALAPGAEVEVKAGTRYQKRRYAGVPITFGLGARTAVDVVRITWPNGLIQNETRPRPDTALIYKEAPRLSGSCPMIFTWDGRGFRFVTDVLGVAPLGAGLGDGTYFPVADREYVRIPRGALTPREGYYDVRLTEELREVSYLDQVELVAVDHPDGIDVFTDDKFKSPPFPEFRLFGVGRRIPPVRAREGDRDVRETLLAADRAYPAGFRRDYAGVAETHALDLDFAGAAPDNRAILVLTGWVDWADGSTFRGAAQGDASGLVTPYLQVKDAQGRWQTVIEDMGMPAGKPKTIVVDLSGRFLSTSREIRIVTNLCVYWDEIFLSTDTAPPPVRLTRIAAVDADLRFRGFSKATIDPERRQPESFDYAEVSPTSMWNPTPGLYTRYGRVTPLLRATDDRLAILGSGDELRLRYPQTPLPALPAGWTRDFLLMVSGWAKDADANTAFSQTVEPLPFHGMSAYPYRSTERYPDTEALRRYRTTYNTRPALRLIRPLYGR